MQALIGANIATPLGEMLAVVAIQQQQAGLFYVDFIQEDKAVEKLAQRWQRQYGVLLQWGAHDLLAESQRQLDDYFCGKRREFSLSLAPHGTPFQQQVWQLLRQIPYGQTWTYSEQAQRYGNLKALRAVAAANGKNPLSIIVPCHRVIGKSGQLVGYAGGLERKRFLLDLEQRFK